MINITFPCFLFRSDAKRDRLCAAVRFSWLNFSGKIRLYRTYFPNYFKFSAATISAISSFNFTHMQPTRMKIYFFLNILFSVKPSHPLQTHLLALSHTHTHTLTHTALSPCAEFIFILNLRTSQAQKEAGMYDQLLILFQVFADLNC